MNGISAQWTAENDDLEAPSKRRDTNRFKRCPCKHSLIQCSDWMENSERSSCGDDMLIKTSRWSESTIPTMPIVGNTVHFIQTSLICSFCHSHKSLNQDSITHESHASRTSSMPRKHQITVWHTLKGLKAFLHFADLLRLLRVGDHGSTVHPSKKWRFLVSVWGVTQVIANCKVE